MSVEEIKQSIAALSTKEQNEVTAFLFHLRHLADSDFHERYALLTVDMSEAGGC